MHSESAIRFPDPFVCPILAMDSFGDDPKESTTHVHLPDGTA